MSKAFLQSKILPISLTVSVCVCGYVCEETLTFYLCKLGCRRNSLSLSLSLSFSLYFVCGEEEEEEEEDEEFS